jgi:hypothetical protein
MILRTSLPRLTTSFGAIQCEPEAAAEAYVGWQAPILAPHGMRLTVKAQRGGFDAVLKMLLPLTAPIATRFVFAPLEGGWTLFVDNSILGTDASSAMRVLAQLAGVPAARVTCKEDRPKGDDESVSEQFGARIVEVYAPDGSALRSVFAANDGGRWRFGETGERLPFERPGDYEAKRVKERFTESALLHFLCGLGIADRERGICVTTEGTSTLIEKMGALPASLREYFVDPKAA